MIDALHLPPKPAILRMAEPWEVRAHADMERLRIPLGVRLAVIAELRRLQGSNKSIVEASARDLERFAKVSPFVLSGMIINPYVFGSTGTSYTLAASPIETVDGSTTTFSSQNFGTADASRLIVAAFGCGPTGASPSITSVTIGGVTATLVETIKATDIRAGIYVAAVPTGTSGTVTIVWSTTADSVGCNLYALYNCSATPTDHGNSIASTGTFDLDVAANGIAVAYQVSRNNTDVTHTWAGLTEDTDDVLTSGAWQGSGGSARFATTQTNLTCSCTPSAGNLRSAFVAASFPPA